jgi:RNA polymerase sigma-70 factor (ECF subfamily)
MAPPLLLDDAALTRPSFDVLYAVARSYLPGALRLLKVPRHEIDDLLHDIVLAAHESLNLRGRQLVPLGAPTNPLRTLKAWLSGIAWRQVRNRRGRGHGRFELPSGEAADLPLSPGDEASSSEQLAADVQRCRIVARVLERIQPERAEVLIMFVLLELSVADIARELGINQNTVKSRLVRARRDFVATAKRLSADERGLLTGCALLLPLGLDGWWPTEDDARWTPHPRAIAGSGLGFVAATMVGLALCSGGALAVRARATRTAAPEIVAVRDLSPAEATPPPSAAAPPAVLGALPTEARPEAPPVARTQAKVSADDTVSRERACIVAARRALQEGAHVRALAALDAHEQQFPHGALAREREWLKGQARSALTHGRARNVRR